MNKAKNLIPVITLFSCSAMAQNIDVSSAATGALVTVLIRGAIAFCLFRLITLNLTRKNIDTPIKSGRWLGAWLMGVSILTNPSLHKMDIDFYVGTAIMAVVWFVIGFVIGFIWRKFKPLNSIVPTHKVADVDDEKLWEQASAELNSSNKNEGLWAKCFAESGGDEAKAKAQYLNARVSKLNIENTKTDIYAAGVSSPPLVGSNNYLVYGGVALAVISAFLFINLGTSFIAKQTKDITYNVFGCKDVQSEIESCDREVKTTAKFSPNKNTQQVAFEFIDIKTQKLITQNRTDCTVIDDKNWSCVKPIPKAPSGAGQQIVSSGGDIEMKNEVVTATGLTMYIYNNGRFISQIYLPSRKFVAQ